MRISVQILLFLLFIGIVAGAEQAEEKKGIPMEDILSAQPVELGRLSELALTLSTQSAGSIPCNSVCDEIYQSCVANYCQKIDPDSPEYSGCAGRCDILSASSQSGIKPCLDICDLHYEAGKSGCDLSNAYLTSMLGLLTCTEKEGNERYDCAEKAVKYLQEAKRSGCPAGTGITPAKVVTAVPEKGSGGLTVLLQMNKEGQYLTYYVVDPYKIDITIVDEYQNPVRGASVTLTFTNTVYGTGTSRSYTTDETGHITVTGEIDKSLVGSQRVSVTATKEKYNRGYAETYINVINLADTSNLEASFSTTPVGGSPLSVRFDEQVRPEGVAVKYLWNFGDTSAEASGKSVTHTFPKAGEYPVSLRVEDTDGRTDTNVITVRVGENGGGTAKISLHATSPDGLSGTKRCFTYYISAPLGGTAPEPAKITWDFGDGRIAMDAKNPCHDYPEHKNYWVTLTIDFTDGTRSTVSDEVIIAEEEKPAASPGAGSYRYDYTEHDTLKNGNPFDASMTILFTVSTDNKVSGSIDITFTEAGKSYPASGTISGSFDPATGKLSLHSSGAQMTYGGKTFPITFIVDAALAGSGFDGTATIGMAETTSSDKFHADKQ